MTRPEEAVEPRDCPYVGLDYYHEKSGAWFFGREADGSKIITNMQAARLTLLHAESGVGKSSILRANVAWRLHRLTRRQSEFGGEVDIPVVFSSWKDDPLRDLVGAIGAAIEPFLAGRAKPELPIDRLDAAIEAASEAVNASLLIMLDQFEEYFLYRCREPVAERFADELARCINRVNLSANFLIAIREDAYAGLGDLFKGRIANVYGNYLRIEYLDRAAAEKAIRAPLDVYNRQPDVSEHVNIQDELVDAVLDQVRASRANGDAIQGRAVNRAGRVATSLLQLVMETIWKQERAEGSHELRLSTLQNLEGVEKIVDTHLGNALSALSDDERQTAIDMFDHLVTPSGGKIAESIPDLAHRTGQSEEQIGQILEKLDHARIVRPVPAPPGQNPVRFRRYEIFHDVLAPTIDRTVAAHKEQRRERQRRRARRLRLFRALAVGLLIVALAVAGVFAYLLHSAAVERLVSESRQLAAYADLNIAHDPELSVLLALKALGLQDTSQAEEALRTALPELQEVQTFQVGRTVYSAAFDPVDANKVASADRYGVASIWDVRTGRRLVRMSLGGFNATGAADAVAFNPAGTEVAVGFADGHVALFDARSGRKLESTTVTGSPTVNDVKFVGGTGVLAIATQKGAYLWPGNGSTPFQMLRNGQNMLSGGINTIAADPHDPLKYAVATNDSTVILELRQSDLSIMRSQSLNQGQPVGTADSGAAFSPDGSQVVTADSDGKVRTYSVATGKTVMTLDAGDANATSVAFSPDGSQIAAGYSSGKARVWDVSTRVQLTQFAGNAAWVYAVRFSPDGSKVVTASDDGTVRVWYSRPRELQTEFTSFSANGAPNLVVGSQYISRNRIVVLDGSGNLSAYTPAGARLAVIGPHGATAYAAWDTAGTQIVTVDYNGTVDVWHAADTDYTQMHLSSTTRVNGVQDAAMSPDGSLFTLVTSDNYYAVQLRNAQTGQLLKTLDAANSVSTVAFSPSGRQILAADYNGQVEVWDAATGHRRLLGTPGPPINDIEFNQSGSEFVTASKGGSVTVWAAPGDRPLISFEACSAAPGTASPSPDGSKIVIACGDGTALVFDAATGQQLTVLPETSAVTVSSAVFSPDGKSIITVVDSGGTSGVQIWNAELANASPSVIARIAEQRITRRLTPTEQQHYLAGIG